MQALSAAAVGVLGYPLCPGFAVEFCSSVFFSWVGVVLHKHFGEAPASQMNREQSKGGAPLLSCYRVWGGKKVPHPDSPRAQLFPARFGCPSCPPSVSLTAASFLSYLLQIS